LGIAYLVTRLSDHYIQHLDITLFPGQVGEGIHS